MKYKVRTEGDKIILKLGTNHEAEFNNDATLEHIVGGVAALVEKVSGIHVFPMIQEVWNAQLNG